MNMRRTCAALRCRSVVRPGMLMCKPHWFTLPARLRNAILVTWRARQMSDYQANVAEAVDYIDDMPGPFDAPTQPRNVGTTVAIAPNGATVRFEQGRML